MWRGGGEVGDGEPPEEARSGVVKTGMDEGMYRGATGE